MRHEASPANTRYISLSENSLRRDGRIARAVRVRKDVQLAKKGAGVRSAILTEGHPGPGYLSRVSTTYPSETEQTPVRDLATGAPTRVRRLGIVGAGTMGNGIAALAASAGVPAVLPH